MKRLQIFVLIILVASLGAALRLSQAQGLNCAQLSQADCDQFSAALAGFRSTTIQVKDLSYSVEGEVVAAPLPSAGPVILDDQGYVSAMDLTGEDNFRTILSEGIVYIFDPNQEIWTAYSTGTDLLQFMESVLSTIQNSTPTRTEDADLNGQTMAVYHIQLRAVDLLDLSPVMQMAQSALTQLPANWEGSLPVVGDLVSEDTVQLNVWVGEDNLVHALDAQANATVDYSSVMPNAAPLNLKANFSTLVEQHGQPATITAPDPEGVTFSAQSGFSLDTALSNAVTSANPSLAQRPIELGQILTGQLDSRLNVKGDQWIFTGQAGQTVVISAISGENSVVDPYIVLIGPDDQMIGFNRNHDTERQDIAAYDAVLEIELPSDGEYQILVNASGEVFIGAYSLSLE